MPIVWCLQGMGDTKRSKVTFWPPGPPALNGHGDGDRDRHSNIAGYTGDAKMKRLTLNSLSKKKEQLTASAKAATSS